MKTNITELETMEAQAPQTQANPAQANPAQANPAASNTESIPSQLNILKQPGTLNTTQLTLADLEKQTNIQMKLTKCIESGENHLVVTSNLLNISKEYDLAKTGNLILDFLKLGHPIDLKAATDMLNIVLLNPSKHMEGYFHTCIGWHNFEGEQIFRYTGVSSRKNNITSTYKGNLELNTSGNLEAYIQGIQSLVVPYKKLLTVYIAGASGIVNQALNEKDTNIMLSLCGESSSGKTTAEHLALSFWGDYSATAMNTINKTDQLLAERQIIPVTVDDILGSNVFSSERTKQKVISNQIFRYSTGEIKGRMYQKSERYYGAVLVSSEQSLFKKLIGTDTNGQFYRMIEMNITKGELTKDSKHARELDRLARNNHGLAAEALGAYMVKHGYTGDKLKDMYYDELDSLEEDKRLKGYSRTANRLAIIIITALLMNKCFNLSININDIKEILIDCVTSAFQVQDLKKKAYEDIHQVVLENIDKFASTQKEYNPSTHVGVYEHNLYGNHELIVPTERMGPLMHNVPLNQILGISREKHVRQPPDQQIQAILRNWRDRGWLYCCGSKKHLSRKIKLGNIEGQTLVYNIIFND